MITDVNVSISRWPCRRLPGDELPELIERLQTRGVTHAWAGSFDALLHRDIDGVNRRLLEACHKAPHGLLIPLGAVNPVLPDWREDLRRCQESYHLRGIRLYPNYHGYTLEDPVCRELLTSAARRGLIVQIAVRMEDVRTQHPLLRVPNVDTNSLAQLITSIPQLQIVLLNGLPVLSGQTVVDLAKTGRAMFDISTLEGVGGIQRLLGQVPLDKILFGSHYPYFLLESALLKLRESDLASNQVEAIAYRNAQRLLPPQSD